MRALLLITIGIILLVGCAHTKPRATQTEVTATIMTTCKSMCAGRVLSYAIHTGECVCRRGK